jgi:FAD/FMN-containing dehydrogenase
MLLGGFGFLSRLHGLSVDNLVEAEVVLADGSIVIVNEREYSGKLVLPSSAVARERVLTRRV